MSELALLSEGEQQELLARARAAAAAALGVAGIAVPGPATGRLAEPGATFVTWRREARLRGCVGSLEPRRPLAEDVALNSVAALTQDPRFAPSTSRDFPFLNVEISVLAPREKIHGASDLELGNHGLYVEKGKRRGLLLPQVAPEWGWSAEEFLEQVCLTAGLPGDAWKDASVGLYRFGAQVFGEAG
ncbi:MAG: AmmeMemoRadiSam system protein A [Thermoanaerobaculia bacterium]